jgi:hypothetical protein
VLLRLPSFRFWIRYSGFVTPDTREPADGDSGLFLLCVPPSVIAQFVLALNNFCDEENDMQYKVSDYSVYDFKTVMISRFLTLQPY